MLENRLKLSLVALLAAAGASPSPKSPLPWFEAGKSGAVVSENNHCSNVGLQLLGEGGSAADAIIGTILCVNTISAYHSGIGGGGFALIREESGDHKFLDFRETAPAASNETMFIDNPHNSTIGGLAVGVPGEIRGLEYLHSNYGRLPWSRPFEIAAEVAEGFTIEQDLSAKIKSSDASYGFLREDPLWSEVYAPEGQVLSLGDTVSNKKLVDTYRRIGNEGPDIFYNGEIADNIIKAIQNSGGIMTHDDLKNYEILERDVLSSDFDEYTVYATSAPSSGAVVLSALNTLQNFDDEIWHNDNHTAQALVESMKFAYGIRGQLADPNFVKNVSDIQTSAITKEAGESFFNRISLDKTHEPDYYTAEPQGLNEAGTSHLLAIDGTGLVISLTTTVNTIFASHVMTENGLVLNNEMDDFSTKGESNSFGLTASPVNFPEPGKRPQSSISPGIVEDKDGNVVLVFGSAGGSQIPTANIQTVVNFIKKGLPIEEAIGAPRLHNQLLPAKTVLEYAGEFTRGYSNSTAQYLIDIGHNVTFTSPGGSTACGLSRSEDGSYVAGPETRLFNSGGNSI